MDRIRLDNHRGDVPVAADGQDPESDHAKHSRTPVPTVGEKHSQPDHTLVDIRLHRHDDAHDEAINRPSYAADCAREGGSTIHK